MPRPLRVILLTLLALGITLRLTALTDPPLDFNPTRQLRAAIIARGMYYQGLSDADPEQRDLAVAHWHAMEVLEPPILERITAGVYALLGGENLAVPRVLNTLLWAAGGVALFLWARALSGTAGAFAGLVYFLFLPFSVFASRSFQPDPGMVVWVILFGTAIYFWGRRPSWGRAIAAAVFGGMAILTKPVAVFFIGGLFAGELLSGPDALRRLWGRLRNAQTLTTLVLLPIPILLYYAFNHQAMTTELAGWTILTRWRDILTPSFYMRWLIRIDGFMLLPAVLLAGVGTLLAASPGRSALIGFWAGYASFCLFFPYHTLTHDYYHLILIPLVALGLAPAANLLIKRVRRQGMGVKLALTGIVLLAIAYPAWIARATLLGQNFADAPGYWEKVGNAIPVEGRAVGYSQDYGFRLMYYGWRRVEILPEGLSAKNFLENYANADYFVITAKNQMSNNLADYLATHYPLLAEGGGYTIYTLKP